MTRRWALRLAVIAAVVALVALAAAVLALPEIARRIVISQVAAATHRPVTLAGADLDLVHGHLALRDLRVMESGGGTLATIARVDVRFRPREIFRGHLRITDASIVAPTVRVVRTGAREFNVSDLLGGPSAGRSRLALTVERLALRDGAIAIEDRTLAPARTWRVDGVTLDVRDVSTLPESPPGVVALHAVAAGSPVSLWVGGVRLAPLRYQATVIARDVDTSLAAIYLPPGSVLTPARGRLDASATIAQDAAGARVALDAVLSGVELRRPGQARAFLSAPAVRLTVDDLRLGPGTVALARVAVDGGTVSLEDERNGVARRWLAEGVAFEARDLSSAREAPAGTGLARAVVAGSSVSLWLAKLRLAPLELHATAIVRGVDVALFRLYVPAGAPVQPERGVVDATVNVDHDAARGTRLTLDARASGLELRRPAHFVTAPALRLTAQDVAFANGAVTIGRAALTGDRLTIEDRTVSPAHTWPVRDLAVEATRLSSRREDVQGIATARATVAGAAVSAWITHVRLEPLELRATAILRNLDLTLAQLYLPAAVPVQIDRGVVNASVQVDHDAAAGTRVTGDVTVTGAQARGRAAVAGVALTVPALRVIVADARRHADTVSVGRVELSGTTSLVDARATPVRLDLAAWHVASEGLTWPVRGPAHVEVSARFRDGGQVTVNGSALLTAPPPLIAWTSELTLDVRAVDVAPLAGYVERAAGVSGRVSGRLAATVAYGPSRSARVRADLTGSQLALADGGRRLVSLPGIEATGVDVLWPERLVLGRLRLDRPRALIEIDRDGRLPLVARFVAPAPAPTSAPVAAPLHPALAVGQVVVDRAALVLVDRRPVTPVRLRVPRVDLTADDVRWPASAPTRVRLDATLPVSGTATVAGTVTGEPGAVDLRLTVADADLAALQPFLPFRAGVRARVDAALALVGPLAPAPRVSARGDVTLRSLTVSDGARPVLTVQRIGARGIDGTWPDRLAVARVRVRRSWALIERDRHGRFLLRDLLQHPAPSPPGPSRAAGTPSATARAPFEFHVGDATFEDSAATIVDATTTPPVHMDVAGARLAVHDLAWPSQTPVRIELGSPAPGGGRIDAGGTLRLDPFRLDARATLDGVEVAPAQPYLPIEGRVAGRVTGDLTVAVALEPLSVKVGGDARLQGFRLSDGNRPVVSVGRAEASGIDVDWPARVAIQRVRFRWPNLLVERDTNGAFAIGRLVTPHWPEPKPSGAAPLPAAMTDGTGPKPTHPTIEVGTFTLERASGKFVDRTTKPEYAEQLSDVDVTFRGLGTAPGSRTRFEGRGALGGGATFTFKGEGATGEPPALRLDVDVRDFPLPRANAYLDRFTSWTATRGTMTASAGYTLTGTRLEARHDLVVRHLEVAHANGRDEVERRVGLPLGLLVSVLKDQRGEIHLSVPVSGDLATRTFSFHEAVWAATRNLAIRLLALPFSRVGSLAFTEDSKVEALTVDPVVFEPGSATPAPAMAEHVERIAAFLRNTPSVKVRLTPVITEADARALATAVDAGPAELSALGTRRLDVVRQGLTTRGIDPARLSGSSRRIPLVEATGDARVELDLSP